MKQKIAELINVIFGFRKFILMMILYIVGIVFRILGLLSGAEMVDLFKATTIAFMGANGVEHLVTGVKAVMAGRNAASQDDNLVPVTDDSAEASVESK
jgi:hypothetical protein